MSNVDHPNHYNIEGRKECIDEMVEQFGLEAVVSFCLMNAYKYLYRAGEKEGNSKEQDIEKAKWYFNWINKQYAEDAYLFTDRNLQNFDLLRKAYIYTKESLMAIDKQTKED